MTEINITEAWQTIVALAIVAWAAGWLVFKLCWPGKSNGGCGSCQKCPQRSQPGNARELHQLEGSKYP